MKTNKWIIWGILVSFFAYQFVMRISPGVMAENLTRYFHIDALQFSLISTFYYIGYASMQLPIGLLLDRYGPRIVTSVCITLCVLGCLLFTYSGIWEVALLGRLLIGMGSSAGFISTSKAIRAWFPASDFSRMVGFSFTIGLAGAINSGRPISYLLTHFSWQHIMVFVCVIGSLLGSAVFLWVPLFKSDSPQQEQPLIQGLLHVFKKPKIIILALLAALMTAPLSVFADVWGVSFFIHVYHWSRHDASLATSFVYFGMCIGAPLLAMISNHFNAHRQGIVVSGMIMMVCFTLIIFFPGLSWGTVAVLLFIMGIFCCYQVLVFSLAAQMTSASISGVVIGFTNMVIMIAGIIFLPMVGYFLNESCSIPGAHYSLSAYQKAFWVILGGLSIAIIGLLFFRPENSQDKNLAL